MEKLSIHPNIFMVTVELFSDCDVCFAFHVVTLVASVIFVLRLAVSGAKVDNITVFGCINDIGL